MCSTGPGKLHRIEGTLKGPQYVDILENVFLPEAMERFGCEATIKFVQDNSPIHTSRIVREWFAERPEVQLIDVFPEIELMEWPAKGADLNPIENAWSMLKSRMKDGENNWRNQNDLFASAKGIWETMGRNPNTWESLVSSMPHRLEMVDYYDGGWTGY